MGGIVAIGLHRGGHDVLIIDPWKPHVENIRTTGFHMTGYYAGEPVKWRGVIPALHTDERFELKDPLDLVFLAVKGYNTQWAVELIRPFLAEDAMVVSLQNGVQEPTVADIVGPHRTIGCETTMGGQTWEPGHIHRTLGGGGPRVMDYMVGEYAGGVTPRVEHLAQMIGDSVGTCGVSDHIMDEVWTKLVVNIGGNMLAAVTSWDTRELGLQNTARVRWALQDEAITVGERLGVRFGSFAGSVGTLLTPEDVKQARPGDAARLGRTGAGPREEIGVRQPRLLPARRPEGNSHGGGAAERLHREPGGGAGGPRPLQPGPGKGCLPGKRARAPAIPVEPGPVRGIHSGRAGGGPVISDPRRHHFLIQGASR